jgi:hypothetical protein
MGMTWDRRPGGAVPTAHLVPDEGVQTFAQAYPGITHDGSHRGPFLQGRTVVEVVRAQGDWVQVAVDGAPVGWVEGRRLVPPVGPPTVAPLPAAPTPAMAYRSAAVPAGNGMAVASLVLGVLAIVFAFMWFFGLLSLVLAPLALIFGWIGLGRSRERGVGGGQAIAGIICGGIALLVSLYMLWVFGSLVRTVTSAINRSVEATVAADPVVNRMTITDCHTTIGNAEASGTLVNTGNETRNFNVRVQFHGPGGDGEGAGSAYAVKPGATESWYVTGPAATALTSCSFPPAFGSSTPPTSVAASRPR